MKELHSEEEIKARLRELTRDTHRVRRELEAMVRHEPDRSRSFSHDIKYKLSQPDVPPSPRRRKPR